MALFPVLVFVPMFYTSDMGVPLAVTANIILVVRIFDVFTDPLIGYVSDRTVTRWGRRKPWIVAVTPIMMLGFYMLFLPFDGAGAAHMFGWMLFLSLGTTMMMIPCYAWGAELSPDYNERSRITGWRSMTGVVGSLIAQLDLDTLKSGENRAALFFSTWSFSAKMSGSIGGWIALTGLALAGFNSAPGALNAAEPMFGLRFMFALLPSAFYLLAGAIIWSYPITEKRHEEMRAELEERTALSGS